MESVPKPTRQSNVRFPVGLGTTQWAAVRTTVGEMSVPVQSNWTVLPFELSSL